MGHRPFKKEYSKKETFVIALGGSLVFSDADGLFKIKTRFLKRFHDFILGFLRQGTRRFIVVAGGGKLARSYQKSAFSARRISDNEKDWLGIYSTMLNARLLMAIFGGKTYPTMICNPGQRIAKKDLDKYSLFVAAGWRPGCSTDYVAVLLGRRFKARKIIIATNVAYVYDKNIGTRKKARPLKRISWRNYRKLVGPKWIPGMSAPVDPVAARFAQENELTVNIVLGTDLKNFEKVIEDKRFKGTIITLASCF
jgi:uridylate kinase